MTEYRKTERTRVKRLPKRAEYDVETVNAIIDEALICHVATQLNGQPLLQPTIHWRDGNQLYIHGSSKNGLFKALLEGAEACIAIPHLDGIVFARSAFHHSVNYRSVVIYSRARLVEDIDEKRHALDQLLEKFHQGRSKQARPANEIELKATSVLAFELDELSAKIRTGGPVDDAEDMTLPVWAGVQPVITQLGEIELDGQIPR
ncbi:pyridoxamine 5'-phosphate oxidase family protein [Marinobacterium sp. D7]|uniref:pyridoxamine 5'-phosphate oxidase family protein n=1 Tax=Marinobacterium ramblicola TaxID=2849041 RepID=UPI001C2D0B92|nr:pyridoxamine 5'-phosphate oxidase family protein [Marinobacterium ramblicola]MBV1790176.1 pyridoxamine 5'-phosphate oxidase family protein [Marinobacterium ramblicola]